MRHGLLFCSLLASFVLFPSYVRADSFDPGWAPFVVTVESRTVSKAIPYGEFALFHLPGEEVTIRIPEAGAGEYQLHLDGQAQVEEAPGGWRWRTPPKAGLTRAEISARDGSRVALNLFVKRPQADVVDGFIDGYQIGFYPTPAPGAPAIHLPPAGFVEVSEDLLDVRVSPHFTLGEFLCKQQPDHWPKFLVLQPPLVIKLELLLEEVNRRGIRTDSLFVMSGYRTPWYNRNLGNGQFSRHVWGAAADIFIDTTGNGRMDDLTGNGKSGLAEARILQRIVQETFADPPSPRLVGGLGLYGPRPHRGPFIHVDVRGEQARWEFP